MVERKGGGGAAAGADDLSHDPRTWLRLKPSEPAAPTPAQDPVPEAEDLSHDPRTWLRLKPQAAEEPETATPGDERPAEPASFDPSTWAKRPKGEAEAPAAEPAAGDGTASAEAPSSPPRRGGLALIAGAAAVVVIGGGAAAWWFTREPDAGAAPAADSPAPVAAAAAPAALPPGVERSVLTLAGADGLVEALTAQGVPPEQAQAAAAAALRALGPASGELRVELALNRAGAQAALAALTIRRPDGSGAEVTPAGAAFAAKALAAATRSEIVVARGQMDAESFYTSAVAAGVNDALIPEFAAAFAFDFDFQREIKPGDVFEAAFEQTVNDRGQPIGAKRLLYASLTTAAKSKALYRFTAPGEGEAGWFDGAGRSIRRSLMRTPVEGARISSQFGYRTHPILGYTKLHKGTDFAAPTGTPIYAAGDGVIEFAGPRGAAGNFVSLRHDTGWRTTYMHMNAFAPVAVTGARITQGTEIGQVGTTGRSTGPHLHYEVWIDGEPVDSMTIQVQQGVSLEGEALKSFEKERDRIDALRAKNF